MSDLRKAAQAVIDRWHTPNWAHDSVHTGVLIDNLRAALADPVKSVVGVDYGSSDMSCKINGTLHVDGSVTINSVEYTEAQPVQSSWVELTDDEVFNLAWDISHENIETVEEYKLRFASVISAALKFKNARPPIPESAIIDMAKESHLAERPVIDLVRKVEGYGRVPMTEDEAKDIIWQEMRHCGDSTLIRMMLKTVRAVENHHGIKEQKP